ncbi:hypothetical protein HF521_005866 [Silurus meridionalis]|uniref:PID domain-containing protein n=1 Tax=Silurus meridionalis TaxID=175797 RepID=A0A8T0AU87_SILME|nr:hypothetical protein HF521_005866 [Silurus meridionalis]
MEAAAALQTEKKKKNKVHLFLSKSSIDILENKTKFMLYSCTLSSVSFCAVHQFQSKLFGFIANHPALDSSHCYVFQSTKFSHLLVSVIGDVFQSSRCLDSMRGSRDLVVEALRHKSYHPSGLISELSGFYHGFTGNFDQGHLTVGGVRRMGGADGPVERVDDDDSLDGRDRQEDIARFPYVEFTGRDSITCPTCQGSGRIPSEQLNELVALIPYSDQRLQPQRTKQYVGLSVIVCLFICSLITFFMFPRPVLVEDGGIRSVLIHFDHDTSRVLINMTSALNFNNGNFFTVLVESVSSRVLYMKTVIGTQQLDNIISIQPLSQRQMNFTVSVEISGSLSYVYAFCTMASIKVHNIVVFTQTSVKTAYVVRSAQNTLEAYRYIDCDFLKALKCSVTVRFEEDKVVEKNGVEEEEVVEEYDMMKNEEVAVKDKVEE